MKLAITLSVDPQRGGDFLHRTYVALCAALDALPVPVPSTLADPVAYVEALGLEGLILSGGGDVDPAEYGAVNTHSTEIAPERDRTERALLGWAVERHKPIIGICRGLQVINVYFGGSLVQDIPALLPGACQHEKTTHPVTVTHAPLAQALGARVFETNSFHHQGVTSALLAPDLEAVALSEHDGVIEALWHGSLPILGVQWHPERPSPSTGADYRLLRACLDGSLWSVRG